MLSQYTIKNRRFNRERETIKGYFLGVVERKTPIDYKIGKFDSSEYTHAVFLTSSGIVHVSIQGRSEEMRLRHLEFQLLTRITIVEKVKIEDGTFKFRFKVEQDVEKDLGARI